MGVGTCRLREAAPDAACAIQDSVRWTLTGIQLVTPTRLRPVWRWRYTVRAVTHEIDTGHRQEAAGLMAAGMEANKTATRAVVVWRLCTHARRAAARPNSRTDHDQHLCESAAVLSASLSLLMPCT